MPAAIGVLMFAVADPTPSRAGSGNWVQDGEASYYGHHWDGHRTSSGARFDPEKLTAAHASLPLGTRLLVTAVETGRSVVVTVNDRQPDHGGRIIDLSPAAARRLDMLHAGIADVEISPATPRALDGENATEVAEAPNDTPDAGMAAPRARRVNHGRHGRRHTPHVRP